MAVRCGISIFKFSSRLVVSRGLFLNLYISYQYVIISRELYRQLAWKESITSRKQIHASKPLLERRRPSQRAHLSPLSFSLPISNRKSGIRLPRKSHKNHRPKIFKSQIFRDFLPRISALFLSHSHVRGFLFQRPASSLQPPEPSRDTAIRILRNPHKTQLTTNF